MSAYHPFRVGMPVVTRRGKVGTVERIDGDFATGTVAVRFGSRVFDMRPSSLVTKLAADYSAKRSRRPTFYGR